MSPKGIRQRVLVSKMELFNLYKEVEQIRNQENKDLYFARFKAMMKDAEFVEFNVLPKKEGGNHDT